MIKINININILILITLLVVILCVYFIYKYKFISFKDIENFNTENNNIVNKKTIDLKPNNNPELENFNQKYNYIYYKSFTNTNVDMIDLGKNFVIKQIFMKNNVDGSDTPTATDTDPEPIPNNNFLRITVINEKDNRKQVLVHDNYGFQSNNYNKKDSKGNIVNKHDVYYVKKNYSNDTVLDVYGNDVIGNKIYIERISKESEFGTPERYKIIDTPVNSGLTEKKIIITGHLPGEKNMVDNELIEDLELEDITTKLETEGGENYVVYKIVETTKNEKNCFNVYFNNNLSKNNFMYYSHIPSNNIYDVSTNENSFRMNNNGKSTIYITKPIIANYIKITTDNGTLLTNGSESKIYNIYGRLASLSDISAFKLNYGITDIKESINHESVCPSVDKLVDDHLKMDMIMDGIEFQQKVNNEKRKMVYNKNKLLDIQEQQMEIKHLQDEINSISNILDLKDSERDIHNSMQYIDQLKTVMKLKTTLDDQIATREKNTFDIDISTNNINTMVNGDNFISKTNNIPLPKEEKLKLFD
jgi:hypothetical protein